MNRYFLSARSLISNSWLVRSALIAFGLVSCAIAWHGQSTGVIIFFLAALVGMGYTCRVYLKCERRRLVPGMNETCALVAISTASCAWVICSALDGVLVGFRPEFVGGCLLGLALALWVGCLEKAALFVLVLPYLISLLAVSNRELMTVLTESYTALPDEAHIVTGMLLGIGGVVVLFRFWFVVTSKQSPIIREKVLTEAKQHSKLSGVLVAVLGLVVTGMILNLLRPVFYVRTPTGWAQAALVTALHTGVAFCVIGVLYVLWRGLIQYFSPGKANLTDIGDFLFGTGQVNRWPWLPRFVFFVCVVAFFATQLIEGSETDVSIHGKVGFCLMFPPFIVGCILMDSVSKQFSRLWMTAASNNRRSTAKILLLASVARVLPSTLLVIALALSVAMSTSIGALPTFVVAIGSVAVAAINFWLLARAYPWIAHHVGAFVPFYLLVLGIAVIIFVTYINELMFTVAEGLAQFGALPCVGVSVAMTTGIWFLCLWDASRALGESGPLMETPDDAFVYQPQH